MDFFPDACSPQWHRKQALGSQTRGWIKCCFTNRKTIIHIFFIRKALEPDACSPCYWSCRLRTAARTVTADDDDDRIDAKSWTAAAVDASDGILFFWGKTIWWGPSCGGIGTQGGELDLPITISNCTKTVLAVVIVAVVVSIVIGVLNSSRSSRSSAYWLY